MNPDEIEQLRRESLAATLTAARGRRRRRAGVAVLVVGAVMVGIFAVVPHPAAPLRVAVVESAAPGSVVPPKKEPVDPHIIRTGAASVTRITTPASAGRVRFSTDPDSYVERLDTEGLVRCFPDKGIAVIRVEGELPKIVLF